MKWFYNLKIGIKLLIGFSIVAIIAGVVGYIGIDGLNRIKISVEDIGLNNLPSIQMLSTINEAETAVKAAERTIYSEPTEGATYTKEKTNIENAYIRAEKATAIYEKLPKTKEEEELWKELLTAWDIWKSDQETFVTIATELQNIDPKNTVAIDTAIEKMKYQTKTVTSKSFATVETILGKLIDINKASADKANNTASQVSSSATQLLIIVIIIGVVMAMVLGIFISRIISNPIKKLVEAADKLALGEVNVNVTANTKDEIGSLAESFGRMIENIRGQALAAEKIAGGDLTIKVDIKSENDLLGKKLSEMVDKNNEVLGNIATASEQVAVGSKQVSDASISLSEGSTEQASSIEELTASIEEISSQTDLNAKNANKANELAGNAKANAVQGNSQMKAMLNAMEEINESSANISKIIKVIDDIAFQTNMLALNAAVEAARAGQHGKGFAVVAEEVKNLAARSASAAKETTEMIESSIKKSEAGTKIARDTAEALEKIVTEIDKAAVLVNDIAIASNEQASGIGQINQGIMQVSQVVQANSATSEESAAASEELSSQAILLKETVSKFKLRQNSNNYTKHDEFSPDVLKMLENLTKNNSSNKLKESYEETSTSKPKIVLSDQEFGKY